MRFYSNKHLNSTNKTEEQFSPKHSCGFPRITEKILHIIPYKPKEKKKRPPMQIKNNNNNTNNKCWKKLMKT